MPDLPIQAQVVNLLRSVQQEFDLAYVFIAHDLTVVRHISDRVAVMYLGKVVEVADKHTIYTAPLHPYTRALIAAVPVPDPSVPPALLPAKLLAGGSAPHRGCRFAPRCDFAVAACEATEPELEDIAPGHRAACLRVREIAT